MKYCPRCGNTCNDADLHCGKCGYAFSSHDQAGPFDSYPPRYGPPPNNGMAVASMVLGILGIVTMCACIGFALAVVALVLGIVSFLAIRNSRGTQGGSGMAIAGIVTGAIPIALLLILLILSAVDSAFAGTLQRSFSNYPFYNGPQFQT